MSKPQLVGEDEKTYQMHDGEAPFRVAKAGLSDAMHAKIKAMAPKMAGGGWISDAWDAIKPHADPYAQQAQPATLPMPAPQASPPTEVPPVDAAPMPEPTQQPPPQMPPQAAPPPTPVPKPAPAQAAKPHEAAPEWAKEEKQAAKTEYEAQAELGKAKGEQLGALSKQLETNAIEQKAIHARAAQQANASMAEIQKARDEMKATDMTVDPGRFWASRSTPGKIAAIIGLALGAVGAGKDGVNRAAGQLDQMIGRDLEAQKAEHELRLKKGQSAIESATNLYGLHRGMAQDDLAANAAAKGSALELVKAQIEQAEAKVSDPMAKARMQQLGATVDKAKQDADSATHQRFFENGIKKENADSERIKALASGSGSGTTATRSFVAPGFTLAPGAAPKPEELAKWRDQHAAAENIRSQVKQLKALMDKSQLTFGEKSKQAEALVGGLKMSAKNAYELGAISGADMGLMMEQIADPTELTSAFKSNKTMKAKLDQFDANVSSFAKSKQDVLGIVPDGASQPSAPSGAKEQASRPIYKLKDGSRIQLSADGTKWEPVK